MVRYDAAIADAMMVNVTAQKELESLEIFEAERGRVAFRLDVPQEVLNYHGTIHGGFLATLCEIAAGMVAYSCGVSNVALTSSVNFVKAVGAGPLVVRAKTSHEGRSTVIAHCRAETPEGRLVCEATFTLFVLGPLERA